MILLIIYDRFNCNWPRECAKLDGFMHECFFVLSCGRCILHSKNQITGTEEGGSKSGKYSLQLPKARQAQASEAMCVCVCK